MNAALLVARLQPLELTLTQMLAIPHFAESFGFKIDFVERAQYCRRVHNNHDVACAQYRIVPLKENEDDVGDYDGVLVEFWRDDQKPEVIHYAWM